MHPETMNPDARVIFSILKLSRAMRRCPPPRGGHPFPPAIGRLLECVAAAPGVSSRELCEALDLRPSSLSEMLARAEEDSLLFAAGDSIRGHEFHYWDADAPGDALRAVKPSGRGWRCANVSDTLYAGFPHLYFPSAPQAARRFVRKCLERKNSR